MKERKLLALYKIPIGLPLPHAFRIVAWVSMNREKHGDFKRPDAPEDEQFMRRLPSNNKI